MPNVKPISYSTIKRYSGQQLWSAVCARSDRFRREAGGQIFMENGDHFAYHANEDYDVRPAILALYEMGALVLSAEQRQSLGVY